MLLIFNGQHSERGYRGCGEYTKFGKGLLKLLSHSFHLELSNGIGTFIFSTVITRHPSNIQYIK